MYADLLLAEGDPRGELIALDLDPQPSPAWHERRRAVMAAWLGKQLAGPALNRVKLGFLETAADHDGLALLASPAGAFVTSFQTRGEIRPVRTALAKLAAQPRPWLARLAIQTQGEDGVGAALVDELIAGTPALRALELSGANVVAGFAHPGVRELRVSGATALDWERAPPAAEQLDLAFLPVDVDGELTIQRTDILAAARLDALVRLDLSRNEGGARAPHLLGGTLDALDVLLAAPLRAQLTHLVLPSIDGTVKLRRALDSMPVLQHVRIARLYAPIADEICACAPFIELPPVWPWPPRDCIDPREQLSIAVPGEPTREVDLAGIVVYLEQAWATLSPQVQAAWHELWGFVADLAWDATEPFPFAVLDLALSTCPADFEDVARWSDSAVHADRRAATPRARRAGRDPPLLGLVRQQSREGPLERVDPERLGQVRVGLDRAATVAVVARAQHDRAARAASRAARRSRPRRSCAASSCRRARASMPARSTIASPVAPSARRHRGVAEILDHPRDDVAHEILVVDHEHRAARSTGGTVIAARRRPRPARTRRTSVPAPGADTTRMPPPCARTMPSTAARPRPWPRLLGREERLEHRGGGVSAIHAGTVVADLDARRSRRPRAARTSSASAAPSCWYAARRDRDRAAAARRARRARSRSGSAAPGGSAPDRRARASVVRDRRRRRGSPAGTSAR